MPLSETAKATPTLPFGPRSGVTAQRDAALLGELHRIVDQVFQRRAQANGIADHERRQLFGNLDRGLQALRRRPAGQRIAGVARQRAQIEEILPHPEPGAAASRGIDEQRRKAGEMFGAGLDGIDPAPLALVEVGGRQQIADRQNSGQRRADLMRERRQRGLDHAGRGGRGGALARLAAAAPEARFFGGRFLAAACVRRERDFAAMIPLTLAGPACHGRAGGVTRGVFGNLAANLRQACGNQAGRPGGGCRPASRLAARNSRKPVASVDFESFCPAPSRTSRWCR